MKAANRSTGLTVLVIGMIIVLMLPLAAYAQRPSGGGAATSSGSASSGSGAASASRGVGGGVSYSGSSGTYSEPSRNIGYYGGSGVSQQPVYTRFPVNSSFTTYNYLPFQNFYYWMMTNYNWFQLMQFGLYDTHRFMVNREPLVTPQMLHLTLESPLAASQRLVTAVDDLQAMVDDMQAGKPVPKDQVAAKAQEIRELAKKIRSYPPLAFFDLGKQQDVTKDAGKLGLGAIDQLREMAVALNTQLKTMYNQSATSTVSVNSLNQASLQSLSKGIEKLSKTIENARPRG